MSDQTLQLLDSIRLRLQHARRRITLVDLFHGVLLLLGTGAGVFILATLFEAVFWMPSWLRVATVVLAGLAILGVLTVFLLVPLLRNTTLLPGLDDEELARRIGRSVPGVGDRLMNLLQLAGGRHTEAPEPFVDRAVRHLGEPIRDVEFDSVASWNRAWKTARFATLPLILLAVVLIAAPGMFLGASERLVRPMHAFERPAPFTFGVSPGSTSLTGGSSLVVTAELGGPERPDAVAIETQLAGEIRSSTIPMQTDGGDSYSHQYVDVRQAFSYRIVSGDVRSPWFDVDVSERPLIQTLKVGLTSPSYTRLPVRELADNVGDVTALVGSTVDLSFRLAGAPTAEAMLAFESGREVPLAVAGSNATGTFDVRSTDTWRVILRSDEGVENADAITYRVDAVSDAAPSAAFLAPELLVDLTDENRIGLLVHITDDFGFRDMALHYRLADSRFGTVTEEFSSIEIPLESGYVLDQEIPWLWDLAESTDLDPVPGDVIEYYVEVRDNDTFAPFKPAQTSVQKLRVPSLAEQYETLDEDEQSAEELMERMQDEAERIRDRFESLRDDLRQQPEAGWQDERRVEQLRDEQQQMESALDELSSQMEEISSRMNENDLVSEETMSSFEELKNVVEEIRTPEMTEALDELQQALENMSPQSVQDALEKFEFNEQMYQERLNRTLDLFKQFRVQQDMEEIQKRAEDLAETEDRLAEETAAERNQQQQEQQQDPAESQGQNERSEENRERLAEEQEMAAEEMRALEEKMEQALERMEELRNQPSEEFQDMTEDLQDQNMPQQMQDNAGEIRENELDSAQQQQQQMSENLQSLQSDMSEMQMSMQGAQMQLNTAAIRAALEDVLTLSQQQENLRLEITDVASDSPLIRPAAQRQAGLSDGLRVVSDSLQSIAREVPQMSRAVQEQAGNALREMSGSTEALTERQSRQAAGHQRAAMTSLNELALMLSELMNQMMNGSGQGSSNMSMEQMTEQLQQMGQQQQELNQQVQQLLNDMQGNRLTEDMQERLRQLGSQQEQIRSDLRQLSRERDARNKLLGDLNRIAEQMAESIEEMQQNQVSRRTVQRQQQILTRLLEASKSLQERGKDNKRQGRTAEEILRDSPADLTPSEQAERLRRDLIRALETGYSSDYQNLIRRYFELLQTRESPPPGQ